MATFSLKQSNSVISKLPTNTTGDKEGMAILVEKSVISLSAIYFSPDFTNICMGSCCRLCKHLPAVTMFTACVTSVVIQVTLLHSLW